MPSGQHPHAPTRVLWILPLAALLAILPLILRGNSCGQDLAFHVQSWLDAAQQLRHGHYPHWDFTAAWNAGEPRFLFYPPLSWLLGATLTLIFPIAATPALYIFIALLASGLTFYKFASSVSETRLSANAALIASALYLANPYMLFCAFERSALAELLAAAWIPLLLLAILRPRPTIRGIAIPIALLWLTNAPAAVIGSYTLALLAILRVLLSLTAKHSQRQASASTMTGYPEPLGSGLIDPQKVRGFSPWCNLFRIAPESPLRLALTYLAGTLLGLALPAFYLIPAAYERRLIQVAMAIIPNLRYQDNFLFTRNSDAAHNAVNHTASTLALTLLILTAVALITLLLRNQNPGITQTPENSVTLNKEAPTENSVILSEVSRGSSREAQSNDPEESNTPRTVSPFPTATSRSHLTLTLICLAAIIAFLLTPLSAPIWHYLPELAFLQFPWRLLILLTPILALAIALLLDGVTTQYPEASASGLIATHGKMGFSPWGNLSSAALSIAIPLVFTLLCFHLYAQSCDPTTNPATIAENFATHHGFPSTDEYTPTNADNDLLRSDNPGYWFIPQGTSPNTPAPNTLPTATELNPRIDTDDTPIPLAQTLSTPAPHHLTLNLPQPETLVLNLRAYPNWRITRTPTKNQTPQPVKNFTLAVRVGPARHHRNDGLIAIAIPSGPSTLDIAWHDTPDQQLGLALSVLALIALSLTYIKPSTRRLPPSA